ncbi:MAG: regulatory protein RecX, partial [Thermodesulfobacteriota bacterium]
MGRPHEKKIKGKKQPSNGVKEAALRLLSFRAHTEKELRRKLVKKGFPAIEIAAITEKLKKLGYLDDRVFSKILAASRSKNKNWGRIKIAAELRDKGVERDIIQEAIGWLGPKEERESAKNAFEKWSAAKRVARPLQKDDLVRAIRHLCARGFSQSIALCAA